MTPSLKIAAAVVLLLASCGDAGCTCTNGHGRIEWTQLIGGAIAGSPKSSADKPRERRFNNPQRRPEQQTQPMEGRCETLTETAGPSLSEEECEADERKLGCPCQHDASAR